MESIKLFLGKFTEFVPADWLIKNTLRELIQERWGVEIKPNDIKLSGSNLFLKAKPSLKSEIFLHQIEIIQTLKDKLSQPGPKKII